jgi:transcriptional regulator with XRE-family HTH domain
MTTKFSSWLNNQFLLWEQKQGKRQTISAFARYLGVPQSSISSWMAGAYEPSGENVLLLASKLGSQIYDILEVAPPPIPDPEIAFIASVWGKLSESDRQEFLALLRTKASEQVVPSD